MHGSTYFPDLIFLQDLEDLMVSLAIMNDYGQY